MKCFQSLVSLGKLEPPSDAVPLNMLPLELFTTYHTKGDITVCLEIQHTKGNVQESRNKANKQTNKQTKNGSEK